ncbi:MAG: DUF4290 domain-containing protein [Bacteroidetes bacterium]|nr:DUF4290 domain-containing protein [Bacteroidota bacterium]
MEYNSTRNKLIIAEYGRNVQKMIEHAVSVEDREKRNQLAKGIIRVMGQINPHLRDVADFTHKLWDHLFIISEFKLDVNSPYPIPTEEILNIKPEQVPYTDKKFAFRHYGRNIELMIDKATTMEEGPAKERIIQLIANHLKKSYLTWNRDSVDDEVIVEHLNIMSKGQLKLNENFKFNSSFDILAKTKPPISKNKPGNNNPIKRNNPIKKNNNFPQAKRKEN